MLRCVVLPNLDGRNYGFTLRESFRGNHVLVAFPLHLLPHLHLMIIWALRLFGFDYANNYSL